MTWGAFIIANPGVPEAPWCDWNFGWGLLGCGGAWKAGRLTAGCFGDLHIIHMEAEEPSGIKRPFYQALEAECTLGHGKLVRKGRWDPVGLSG